MIETYSRAMDWIYRISMWIAGWSIVVMSVIIPLGVYYRYVENSALGWPEPVAIVLMKVFTFFGAAVAYRANAHIAVTMITDRVPAKLQKVLRVIVDLLMAAVAIFIIDYGIGLCQLTWGQVLSDLPALSVGITYLPIPLGSAITLLFVIERLIAGPQNHRAIVRVGSEEAPHPTDAAPAQEAR